MDSGTATTADSGTVTRRDGGTATKVIGAEGGTLESSEANAKLVVPRGALSSQVSLTIGPAPAAPEGALKAIEIGPSGTKFQTAATVIISYEGMSLGGMDAANLRVATVSGGMWVALEGSTVDERTKEAKGNTTHLSPFGLIGVDPGPPPVQPTACTTLNMCADGCPCDAPNNGTSCQRGTDGMAGCTRCACDGTSFSCSSCATAGAGGAGGAGGSGAGGATAGAGGAPMTCTPTEHCDTSAQDSMCIEYAAYPAGDVQKLCTGTYGKGACSRTGSVGACVKSFAGQCDARWYFPPGYAAAADVQGICTSLQRSYSAP